MDRKGDKREPAVMVRTLGKRNVGGFVFRKKAPKKARRRAAGSAAADTAAPDADAAPAAEGRASGSVPTEFLSQQAKRVRPSSSTVTSERVRFSADSAVEAPPSCLARTPRVVRLRIVVEARPTAPQRLPRNPLVSSRLSQGTLL